MLLPPVYRGGTKPCCPCRPRHVGIYMLALSSVLASKARLALHLPCICPAFALHLIVFVPCICPAFNRVCALHLPCICPAFLRKKNNLCRCLSICFEGGADIWRVTEKSVGYINKKTSEIPIHERRGRRPRQTIPKAIDTIYSTLQNTEYHNTPP